MVNTGLDGFIRRMDILWRSPGRVKFYAIPIYNSEMYCCIGHIALSTISNLGLARCS